MKLVLRTRALKLVNKGGGVFKGKKDTGTDYAIFICPACNHRNNQPLYNAENYQLAYEDRIPIKCKMCRTIIEVERPYESKLLITPDQYTASQAQYRKENSGNRVVGRPSR